MPFRSITILIALTSIIVFPIHSQTIISGIIKTEKNESLPGANIYIEGSYDGTSSDASGLFLFETSLEDTVILRASYIGYNDFSQSIIIGKDSIYLEIILYEHINYLNEVVISAGTFEAGTTSKSEVLRPLDIVTTAGVTADVPGALNTLPGTQTVGEQGRLFVRGGDAYETTTFIDGMIVQESYEISAPQTPTRSRFSPFMFSGTSFSTGGYSAEYGQGLSSALILNTKDVATETRTDFSLISVGLEAAHTQLWDDASFAGKISYTDLDPYFHIINQDFDWIDPPTSVDGNIAFRKKVGKDGMFKSYGKFNFSGMQFNYEPFTTKEGLINTQLNNQYGYINNAYKEVISEKWSLNTGVAYSYSNDDIELDKDIINERSTGYHIKSVAGYEYSDQIFFRIGGELLAKAHFQDFKDYDSGFENRFSFSEKIIAPFIESKLFFTKKFLARLGGRMEYNTLNDNLSLDPRLSLALKTGENSQVSMAYGIFRQTPPNQFLRVATHLPSEKATHLIVNYQLIKNNRTFRIEAYNKQYNDLVTYDPAFLYEATSYKNDGSGHALGFDVFFRDGESFNNVDFWVSYSYLDTERRYRDFPSHAAPFYSSKHNFSVVYKHYIPGLKSQLGVTYSYASGRPYNDPSQDVFNGGRTPAYHDLSANISFLPKPNLIIYASVTNVLARENIFGYDYRKDPSEMGLYERRPVTLPAPRFLFLGIFITLTEAGVTSQLPNL